MAPQLDDRPMGDERHQHSQSPTVLATNNSHNNDHSQSHHRQNDASSTSPTDAKLREQTKLDPNTTVTTSSKRTCRKCNLPLTGQFVRALGGTFHLDCFRCKDCGVVVAQKFFPVDDEEGNGAYPLCETDYFRRLDLLCHACKGALRGSYITALDRKYHIEHFTCCVCPTVFGPQDSYYEHDAQVYCHYHYSTKFAARCQGCQTAILKQFVEIFRGGVNQHWHPECYMIHKFWSVKLSQNEDEDHVMISNLEDDGDDPSLERRAIVRDAEERMEEKVYRIWSVLSTFEESSAANISDMLLHVSNGAYVDGVFVAEKFIWHVEILFSSADNLDAELHRHSGEGLAYSREAKLLCKKIVAFFTLLSKTQETGVRKLGITQELLSLVTGLAHYLKLLIRISLQGALKLENDFGNTDALNRFLEELSDLDRAKEARASKELNNGLYVLADLNSDLCAKCNHTIEDECAKLGNRRWNLQCLSCANCGQELRHHLSDARWSENEQRVLCYTCGNQAPDAITGFEHVTKLKQYVYLLRVALARLLNMLKEGGTMLSDNSNPATYDGTVNKKPSGMGRSETWTKGSTYSERDEGYTNSMADVRRLRSTRLESKLATNAKRARQSRIIENNTKPGTDRDDDQHGSQSRFRVVEDRDVNGDAVGDLTFGDERTLTLDDIPRIAATEQARELRPNAFKHRSSGFAPTGFKLPNLSNGHQRGVSSGGIPNQPVSQARQKRYFSELSALEYFIVRHIACVSMLPLVEDHFSLEELLQLIERQEKPTFWNKFGKAFKQDGKSKKPKKTGVFGVPLEQLVEKDGAESSLGIGPGALRVPAIVDDAISAMKRMDMSVEGVFRKNGNIRRLKELTVLIDNGDPFDLAQEGAVQVAALLKKFLRELPDPLLTFKLHRLFIASQKLKDEDKKRRLLHLTCCLLPKYHRDSIEILFSFLNWVASFSHIDDESGSKMDVYNLATVITPNILFSKNKDPAMDDSFLAIEAIHTLIEYNDQMCEVPEDLLAVLNDGGFQAQNADVTTKDILKRYGEIAKMPLAGKQYLKNEQQSSPPRGNEGRQQPAVLHRAENDSMKPGNQAWESESSVRHTPPPTQPQSLNGPNYGHENGSSNNSSSRADQPAQNGASRTIRQNGPPLRKNSNHGEREEQYWGSQPAHQPQPTMSVT